MNSVLDHNSLTLSEVFRLVEDPRSKQGQVYSLQFLLNCAQAAILTGAKGFTQIGEWIDAQEFEKLRKMGNKFQRRPDESTLRKAFKKLEITSFKELCYLWSYQQANHRACASDSIAVDGKTLRASRDGIDRQYHFLSAAFHGSGITIGDMQTPFKKSEINFIRPLLDTIDIRGKVVTADALHTLTDFGKYLAGRSADYVFIAKGNKKKLIQRLEMLDIKNNYSTVHKTKEKSHGRYESRKLFLLATVPWWIHFSTAKQCFIIERECINIKTGEKASESHFGLTSLDKVKADAKKTLQIIRDHWTIENKVFHVRDRTLHEDQSRVSSGVLPGIMIVMRNLALNLFRFTKCKNIAKAIRGCNLKPGKELSYLGIR